MYFSENTVASGGGIYLESANLTASGCTFTKNNTSSGGGITCDNVAATTITNCAFAENIAANNGGGMYVDPDSAPTIMQCRFTGNTAVNGGGIYHGGGITSACIFLQNTANTGGGIYIGDAAMIQNCLFDRNNDTNMTGGALFNAATNYSTLFNSTLCGNSGGIANGNNAKIILTNNILWGNTSEITNASGAAAYASNSCIEGGYSGSYIITSDPCFINATTANGGPNYRLRRSSPCIDHGISTAAPLVDLDGVSRPQHGGFDMGCYEYVNTAPVITQNNPLTVSMSEDGVPTAWTAPALSATDPDGQAMTWSLETQAVHGVAAVSGNGASPKIFTYVPAPNYNGADSFVARVSDGVSASTITINVLVASVNDVPAIVQSGPIAVSMSEDGSPTAWVAPTVSASDIDAGDTLTWMLYDLPSNGTADVSGVGLSPSIFTYTPNPNYNGPDSFRVAVMDSGGEMAFITVNVLVTAVDDAPVIEQTGPVSVSMNEDGAGGPWSAPLISATDGDGDELTWFVETPASHGIATVSGTGASPTTFDYVPQAGYSGGDTFTIAVRDSGGETASIQIEVSISPVNDAPVLNQSGTIDVTMSEDGAPTPFTAPYLSAVDEEGGVLTWYIGGPAAHGNVQIAGVGASPTTFTYTPAPDYTGEDSFIAAVLDDESASAWVTIHVTIEPVNDAPVITQTGPIAVAMSEDGAPTAWTAPALAATDVDGDSLTWSVETPASHGIATVSGTGASPTVFSYAPQADYSGPDSFVIAVDDGQGETASITIEVAIAPVPLTIDLAGEEKVQVKAGDSHTFTATASGGQGVVHYQWFFQPEKGAKAYASIEGATDGAYTLASITIGNAGAYYCQAYDDNTVVDSAEVQLVVLPGVPAVGPGVILLAALTITLVMSWRTHRKARG